MNKVVAVLGIIVLLTLAMLFFCIGFFTGSTITPTSLTSIVSGDLKSLAGAAGNGDANAAANGDGASAQTLEAQAKAAAVKQLSELNDIKSATMSDKIMEILAAAGYTVKNFSEIVQEKTASELHKFSKKNRKSSDSDESHLSTDALLREITASHNPQDDCSYQKTMNTINTHKPVTDNTLNGKKVVFIGYFKNTIAAQIQKLLTSKGYKTHVEISKSSDGHESFIFCGPFKKDETANKLLRWLQNHEFADARVISITKEAIEETLYDAINDDGTGLPPNEENAVVAGAASAGIGIGAGTGTAIGAVSPQVGVVNGAIGGIVGNAAIAPAAATAITPPAATAATIAPTTAAAAVPSAVPVTVTAR